MSKQGRPYSVEELKGAASQPEDEYHRQLMRWAAQRLAALTRERDALTWQPIETAPKDGARIVVWIPAEDDDPPEVAYVQWASHFSGWLGVNSAWQLESPQPTHWMPLPKPPEAGTGGA